MREKSSNIKPREQVRSTKLEVRKPTMEGFLFFSDRQPEWK
jgi:hypothetical protein